MRRVVFAQLAIVCAAAVTIGAQVRTRTYAAGFERREPAGRGGRNDGWRIREGAHDNVTSAPPAFLPLVDPIDEYDHSQRLSITGGFVYRGSALDAAFRGPYFYADYVSGRVWSIGLTIDPSTQLARVSDRREHTDDLGGAQLGNISSLGVDSAGELYVVSHSLGGF